MILQVSNTIWFQLGMIRVEWRFATQWYLGRLNKKNGGHTTSPERIVFVGQSWYENWFWIELLAGKDHYGHAPSLKLTYPRKKDGWSWKTTGLFSGAMLLGGAFKHFLLSPLVGKDFQFDYYFSDGLKPPTRLFSERELDLYMEFWMWSF